MKKIFYLFFLSIAIFSGLSFADNEKIFDTGLFIQENVYDQDNRYLKLNDGSFWLLNYTFESFWDRFGGKDVQAQWLYPQKIEIRYSSNHKYPYQLINLDTNETVQARQINPSLLIYTTLEKLRSSVSSSLFNIAEASSSKDKKRTP